MADYMSNWMYLCKGGCMVKGTGSTNINPLLILTVAICFILLLGPLPGNANAETGVVTGSVVNIRSGPGTQYEIAGTLYKDTSVNITGKSGEWVKVSYGKVSGWVSQSLLSRNSSETYLLVNQDMVNIRSLPSTVNNTPIAQVQKGDKLVLVEVQGEWYKVKTAQGQVAYIRSDMVREADELDTKVPVLPPTSPSGTPAPIAGSRVPEVTLDGTPMEFEVSPRVEDNRVLVPLRAIFEAMGAKVEWNQATQTAIATKDNHTVVLPLNSTQPTVDGAIWELDVPAKVVQQRTLAPLRFVGESLGGTATWDQANFTVILESPPPPVPVEEPDEVPVPPNITEGLSITSESAASGLRIIMRSAERLETELDKNSNQVTYEFADRQIQGNGYLEVLLGNQTLKVQGRNQGDNVVVEIQIPAGAEYRTTSENGGTQEVLTVPYFITGVERTTFGTSGEKIAINSNVALNYTSQQTAAGLEIIFNNVLPGSALKDYEYDSRLIKTMEIKNVKTGSVSQAALTIVTNKAAKFSVGPSSDGRTLNIMFIDQSEIQPRVPMVVLDAGHGGKDTGARGNGLDEKDVNLDVALKVGQYLTQKGIKVAYTRSSDIYLDLNDISAVANLYNAALFVSIHSNSSTRPDPSGTETHYYAPLENPALYIQKDERLQLATKLQQSLMAKLGRIDRGVKHSNFAVLRNTKMPSALVEMSFISNPAECQLLKQQNYRQLAAQAIADGIEQYMKENIKS